MGRACCAAKLVSEVLGDLWRANPSLAHKVVYIGKALFKLDLGYRFKWLPNGPYSEELAKDLLVVSDGECCDDLEVIWVARDVVELVDRVCRLFGVSRVRGLGLVADAVMLLGEVYPRVDVGDVVGFLVGRWCVSEGVALGVVELLRASYWKP